MLTTFEDIQRAIPVGMAGSMIRLQDTTWAAKFWKRRPGDTSDDFTLIVCQREKESPDELFFRAVAIAKNIARDLA